MNYEAEIDEGDRQVQEAMDSRTHSSQESREAILTGLGDKATMKYVDNITPLEGRYVEPKEGFDYGTFHFISLDGCYDRYYVDSDMNVRGVEILGTVTCTQSH